ncbi:MAG: dodecin family protein [Alphaproteobacteria bacterium]
MAVARVTKITAASPENFDMAIQQGIERASRSLRGITGLHVVEQKAKVADGKIEEYRVTMEITFILDD